jgi:hypothetical protein
MQEVGKVANIIGLHHLPWRETETGNVVLGKSNATLGVVRLWAL